MSISALVLLDITCITKCTDHSYWVYNLAFFGRFYVHLQLLAPPHACYVPAQIQISLKLKFRITPAQLETCHHLYDLPYA